MAGHLDKFKGKVEEKTGNLFKNEELEAKGKANILKGEALEKASEVKDSVSRETKEKVSDVKEAAAKKFNDTVDQVKDKK